MLTGPIPWLVYLLIAAGAVLLVGLFYRSTGAAPSDDPSGMLNQTGTAQGTFTQEGVVVVRGELWRATSNGGIIEKGDSVLVREVRPGLILVVSKVQK